MAVSPLMIDRSMSILSVLPTVRSWWSLLLSPIPLGILMSGARSRGVVRQVRRRRVDDDDDDDDDDDGV